MQHRFMLAALLVMIASSCSTVGPRYARLQPNAARSEVMHVMGDCPDVMVTNGAYEGITYAGRMIYFFQPFAENYSFVLKNGLLVTYGEGSVQKGDVDGEPGVVLVKAPGH